MSSQPPREKDWNNFDRLAPGYRILERLLAGRLLERVRCHYMETLPQTGKILLLGDGPGKFLEELVRKRPQLEVVYLEKSIRMIEAAKNALSKSKVSSPSVIWRSEDILHCELSGAYSAAVSHFFLDCFTLPEIRQIVDKVRRVLAPNASWLLSDFQMAPKGWPKIRSRVNLWLMYRFFRLATRLSAGRLADPAPVLQQGGFVLESSRSWNYGLIKSESWRLKDQGD
ncbi:MAG: hypothetical protein JWN25_3666 [Verrucomicrobiales bacterium]|nr:hypothetical protein [Verrucomicrobiales bacterium]